MFFFRHKTKLADTGFFRDFVDSHSHILPGVDDGIRTIEESLAVLAYFDSLGVKKVRLTPHVMNGVEHWEDVLQAFDTLCKRYTGETVLELGAEYMLDSGFQGEAGEGIAAFVRGLCIGRDVLFFSTKQSGRAVVRCIACRIYAGDCASRTLSLYEVR